MEGREGKGGVKGKRWRGERVRGKEMRKGC